MLATDWRLALASFGVIPFVYVASHVFRLKVRESYRDIRTRLARINAYLQERITGMRVVQLFGREASEAKRFDELNRGHLHGKPGLDHLLRAVFSRDRGADVDRAGELDRRRGASRRGRVADRRDGRGVPAAGPPLLPAAAGPLGQVQHAPAGDGSERARVPSARRAGGGRTRAGGADASERPAAPIPSKCARRRQRASRRVRGRVVRVRSRPCCPRRRPAGVAGVGAQGREL